LGLRRQTSFGGQASVAHEGAKAAEAMDGARGGLALASREPTLPPTLLTTDIIIENVAIRLKMATRKER